MDEKASPKTTIALFKVAAAQFEAHRTTPCAIIACDDDLYEQPLFFQAVTTTEVKPHIVAA